MRCAMQTSSPRRLFGLVAVLTLALFPVACSGSDKKTTPSSQSASGGADVADLVKINHLIVIYQENWSFDSLYPYFPGADGIAKAGEAVKQVDKTGKPYDVLPQPIDSNLKPPGPDPRFPANLPVQPFDASKYVSPNDKTGD